MLIVMLWSCYCLFYRFSTSRPIAAGLQEYVAKNEPILGYEKGSPERQQLDAKLKEYDSQLFQVPIVIGDEEIATKETKYQVKVCDLSCSVLRAPCS